MQKVSIEQMTIEDIETVADIMIDAFNNSPVKEQWTKESGNAHLQEVFHEEWSLVARLDGQIVGGLVGGYEIYDYGKAFFVDTLVVKKEYRGNGIGTALLTKAIEVGKERGCKTIELLANAKLQSFTWYKKLNFDESGWVEMVKTLV